MKILPDNAHCSQQRKQRNLPRLHRTPQVLTLLGTIPFLILLGEPRLLCQEKGASGDIRADTKNASKQDSSGRNSLAQTDGAQKSFTLGKFHFSLYTKLEISTSDGSFKTDGQITYSDPITQEETILTADKLEYEALNNRLTATGKVTLFRPDGIFTGSEVTIDLNTRVGSIKNAQIESDYFQMRGELIQALADGSYTLTNGEFTTCIHGRPDYKIKVRQATIDPKKYIRAKRVQLFLGNFALPVLPSFKRNLTKSSSVALPTPGYSKNEGLTFRLQDSPIDEPSRSIDYDLRLNFKELPTGFVSYQTDLGRTPPNANSPRALLPTLSDPLSGLLERINAPTYQEYTESHYNEVSLPRNSFYATLQNEQFVYNRRRSDLSVSRLPEAGVQFVNILGHTPKLEEKESNRELTSGEALRRQIPNAPALLNITVAAGYLHEFPTDVEHGRLSVRSNLASQPILLGKRLGLRLGVTQFLNAYSNGNLYHMLSPEVELDYTPTRTSVFNIAYRYALENGSTPFLFDRRDIRNEVRLQYQVTGPWGFGIVSKWDADRSRAYDTELSVVRNFDCLRVGVAYRARSQSINLIFNFLPPRRDRKISEKMPKMGTPVR